MKFPQRITSRATDVAQGARNAAADRLDGFPGLQALLAGSSEEDPRFERYLVRLVAAVRDDQLPEDRTAKDVHKTAKKRRRRLGMMTFAAGPMIGVASQLVDLYCDTATVCDLVSFHGYEMTDAEIAAHMLVLWSVAPDVNVATAAMAGEDNGVATLVTRRLAGHADSYLPQKWTTVGLIKAVWKARGLFGDARERMTSGPVKTVFAPGKPTRGLIDRAEQQLATTPNQLPEASTA